MASPRRSRHVPRPLVKEQEGARPDTFPRVDYTMVKQEGGGGGGFDVDKNVKHRRHIEIYRKANRARGGGGGGGRGGTRVQRDVGVEAEVETSRGKR